MSLYLAIDTIKSIASPGKNLETLIRTSLDIFKEILFFINSFNLLESEEHFNEKVTNVN
jgi:hypothetical protein